ncbi:NH(3)-dependent NAD(+) synthetase [Eubacterium ruminantium]|nr:NH(3)-dependent NAD(+) synthetase [Eubacterium ruminantium]
MFDFYRVSAAVPDIKVGDTIYNANRIIEKIDKSEKYEAQLIAFPELAVTGYTCQDLFFEESLLKKSDAAIDKIIRYSENIKQVIVVGAPVKIEGHLYNAAYVIFAGRLCGITIKTYLPNQNEFYEKRWFDSANDITVPADKYIFYKGYKIPFGNDIIYDLNGLKFAVEICEDLWAPINPGTYYSLAGAEFIINISASNEVIAKREYRRSLVLGASARGLCNYLYVSAGSSESTQDLIFSGHSMLAENGTMINENTDFIANDYLMMADIDLGKIRSDRLKNKTFKDTIAMNRAIVSNMRTVDVMGGRKIKLPDSDGKYYIINKHPFIPSSKNRRLKRCNEIFDMQVGGLVKRLKVTGCKPIVGVSGGMDSTLALLVAAKALKVMGKPATDLVAITMPAFGTTGRTYNNSLELIKGLGAEPIIIDIKEACIQHLKDLGHDLEVKDIAYENTQARERTQILMDYANMVNGLVVGTGDLSELALGWCTYNGDQMSMYGVNGSIPKTLVRWMIDSVIENNIFPECKNALKDIINTPISPELLPPDEEGNITQKTEDSVGPYELHDFFLYYMMRFNYTPSKIFLLAGRAFDGIYTREEIHKWMKLFYRRFFSQQYKRSCMPDSVKVGSVALSPRGDLRMPSDAASTIWLDEIEKLL